MKGFSGLDIENGPFHDPEAVDAFVEGMQSCLAPNVSVVEVDHHINEREFAEALVAASLSAVTTGP